MPGRPAKLVRYKVSKEGKLYERTVWTDFRSADEAHKAAEQAERQYPEFYWTVDEEVDEGADG